MTTVLLLVGSNIFMTAAWYGHLRFKDQPIYLVILVSWGLAFFEYCLQVPANRWGYGEFTASQLKIIQEGITFSVFAVFTTIYLKERPTLYDVAAFGLIFAGVAVSLLQPKGQI